MMDDLVFCCHHCGRAITAREWFTVGTATSQPDRMVQTIVLHLDCRPTFALSTRLAWTWQLGPPPLRQPPISEVARHKTTTAPPEPAH